MATTMPQLTDSGHHRLSDLHPRMAKVESCEVRKADPEEWKRRVGKAVERVKSLAGLSLKEFADAVDRNERQVAKWMTGEDRPQFDAILANEKLRQPAVIALAEVAGAGVEIETVVRVRRTA